MLDMRAIGRRIFQLRREANITQMALADRLSISFQAVSNWERGQSMPDLPKLYELSEIFNVSIDEILNNPRGTALIHAVNQGVIPDADLIADTLADVAPILAPAQLDTMAKNMTKENFKMIDIHQIKGVLNYLSEDFIGEIAENVVEQFTDIAEIVENLVPLLDYMESEKIKDVTIKMVKQCNIQENAGKIIPLLDYMSDEDRVESIDAIIEKHGYTSELGYTPELIAYVQPLLEYFTDEQVDEIKAGMLERYGIDAIAPLLEYGDTQAVLEAYIRKTFLQRQNDSPARE